MTKTITIKIEDNEDFTVKHTKGLLAHEVLGMLKTAQIIKEYEMVNSISKQTRQRSDEEE